MGFMKPKMPKPAPPPNAAITPSDSAVKTDTMLPSSTSLISTTAQGLKRRASVQRSSLIGGG